MEQGQYLKGEIEVLDVCEVVNGRWEGPDPWEPGVLGVLQHPGENAVVAQHPLEKKFISTPAWRREGLLFCFACQFRSSTLVSTWSSSLAAPPLRGEDLFFCQHPQSINRSQGPMRGAARLGGGGLGY